MAGEDLGFKAACLFVKLGPRPLHLRRREKLRESGAPEAAAAARRDAWEAMRKWISFLLPPSEFPDGDLQVLDTSA